MMARTVILSRTARKQLDKLPDDAADGIMDALETLAENPRPPGCRKLRGRPGYRVRIGDYRVLYDVEDEKLLVLVFAIGHRRDIYG